MNNPINYEELAQAVQMKKESAPEFRAMEEGELLSHVVRERTGLGGVTTPPASHKDAQSTTTTLPEDSMLPSYAAEFSQEEKKVLENLVSLTLEKGIAAGIQEVKKDDPFFIDAYHDMLAQRLGEELRQRHLL